MDRDEQLVAVWMRMLELKETRQWATNQMGFEKVTQLSHRVSYLRKHGVQLPKINYRIDEKIDQDKISKLNKLVQKRTKGTS